MAISLIQKYNVPGPRYTSYPTVPYWQEDSFSLEHWKRTLLESFFESNDKEGISLYIHLPFCESLCTFCGCHKRITKQHNVESPYIEAVLKEWNLYCDLLPETPNIKEVHLGGGTPTFFSAQNLEILISGIFSRAKAMENYELSFEGHPNNTSKEHLQILYQLGFRRVSFGVQDYSPRVQKAIHRIQAFENVQQVTRWAKEIGYRSISHDLVFGLPFQTVEDILLTINKTTELAPDRVAFYSYAHVPWIKGNGQRGFKEEDLPKDDIKRQLYEEGKKLLAQNGYCEIGMDHFALATDSLFQALHSRTLHRNFMGYSSSKTQLMIGLGASSISDSWYSFAQNEKDIDVYYQLVNQGRIPITKGHLLNPEDLIIRRHILNLMCHFETYWSTDELKFPELPSVIQQLEEMQNDGLIEMQKEGVQVSEKGRPFVRNICMAFDLRLKRKAPNTNLFSMTV